MIGLSNTILSAMALRSWVPLEANWPNLMSINGAKQLSIFINRLKKLDIDIEKLLDDLIYLTDVIKTETFFDEDKLKEINERVKTYRELQRQR